MLLSLRNYGKIATRKMKKTTVMWHILLLFYFTLSILNAEQQTVVLQVNESSPIWSKELPLGGMGTEIVQAISKEMDIKTYIEFIPLKRLIADTNNDIGNPLFYMNNQEFAAIIPIAITYNSFFIYNNEAKKTLSKAKSKVKRIGILKGTLSSLKQSDKFNIFEESTSQESLFKKLKAGRLDIVVELDLVGHEMIKNLFPNEVEHFNANIISNSSSPIAILIDINYPNANTIAQLYQEGLNRIIENGIYQKIVEKFHEKNMIPSNWYTDLSKFKAIYSIDFRGNSL